MNCLNCTTKDCKVKAKDCNSNRELVLPKYKGESEAQLYQSADTLVKEGRAGRLSRIEETILYMKENNFEKVAIAYCYAMEKEAKELQELIKRENIGCSSYRCTINGLKECELGISAKESVNCNPIGQAEAINSSDSRFVIEMGLCLGHDVLFHQYLKKPFTVLAVKDRVYKHSPLEYLKAKR